MAQALRVKQNLFKLGLDSSLKQTEEDNLQRIYGDDVVGVMINQLGAHWVAARVDDGGFWLLDSQPRPHLNSFQHFCCSMCAGTNMPS